LNIIILIQGVTKFNFLKLYKINGMVSCGITLQKR